MRIFIIGMVMIALLTVMAMFPPSTERVDTKRVLVPAKVYCGDTLNGICSRTAIEHGDVREDLREITEVVRRQNNIQNADVIQPGRILLIELEVPKEKDRQRGTADGQKGE